MKDLDKKDLLLLDLLGEDSRGSKSRLTKELRMHKTSVLYRIKRLKKLGIIQHFSFIPGLAALGKNTFYILFRIKIDKEGAVYEYFKNYPSTLAFLELSGKWNFMVELICENINVFNDELAKITKDLGERILDYETVSLYEPYKVESTINFHKDYKSKPFKLQKEIAKLDETDKKILTILSKNSDLSYNEISEKTNTTPDIVYYRMKKLTESGVIVKFVPVVDLKKLGFQNYLITLKLSNMDDKKFNSFKNYLVANKNVRFSFRMSGKLGIFIFCAYHTNAELNDFFKNLSNSFGDVIKEQEIIIVNRTISLNYFPKVLQ